MATTITTEELRKAKCAACGDKDECHDELVLVGKCHPRAGVKPVYEKSEHRLRLSCAECDRLVIYIKFPSLD